MTLTTDQQRAVLCMVASELTAELQPVIDELKLINMREAGELLGVGEIRARKLLSTYVDLGERGARVSLKTIKQLISDRTVKGK